jgi:hypothetical protein
MPVAEKNKSSAPFNAEMSLKEPLVQQKTSSTNRRCVIVSLSDTFSPLIDLALFASVITLLRAYVMMKNKKGDIGHPFLGPLEALKSLEGAPFIKTAKDFDCMRLII